MTLHLILTHYWWDQIASGFKDIEYRSMSNYWTRRIWNRRDQIECVRLYRAYSGIFIERKVSLIDVGPAPMTDWPGDYFRIHLIPQTSEKIAESGSNSPNLSQPQPNRVNNT